MSLRMNEVQKFLSGFDYPGPPDDPAQHAEQRGDDRELFETLRGQDKDSFDGPSAVMQKLGNHDTLGGSTS